MMFWGDILLLVHFLPVFSFSQDVNFVMERHPDSYFCGHLQCFADVTHSDHDIISIATMTIYDITRVNVEIKLTSVSIFHQDPYVDNTKSSAMSCTGIISRHQANLTVQLRNDIDCLYGVYKCQLDLVTASGHAEVLTEIVTPEHNHNYSRIAEVINHLYRLTELLESHTTQVNNQTAQIDRLASRLDEQTGQINRVTSQFDDQTAQMNRVTSQLDDQKSQLDEQTAQMNRTTIQLDDQTAQLNRLTSQVDDQTAQMNRTTIQLDDQTAHMNNLASQLDDQTTYLMDQTSQLNNLSLRLDLEKAEQKLRHDVTEEKLKGLEIKIDTIQKYSHQTTEICQNKETCMKGQRHIHETNNIILWENIPVLCDTSTDEGGWIIIQRRTNGNVDFYRGWEEYKNGFGNLDTDFWIGNDVIHNLTSHGYNELRVDLIYQGKQYYVHYSNFSVANESMNYRLSVSGYSGTAGDSFSYHNNMYFSTFDRDNDRYHSNCARDFKGAWWHHACHHANLNGLWGAGDCIGLRWSEISGCHSVSFSEIKLRSG